MKHQSAWGQQIELKGNYKNQHESEVIKYKMDKEELEEYLKELEMKNKYKNVGFR